MDWMHFLDVDFEMTGIRGFALDERRGFLGDWKLDG